MIVHNNARFKRNNFDLLRLLFAGTVCLFHAKELSGFQQINWISNALAADIAVKAFFIVSGFLIFMSYERSSSLKSYLTKRIRRIYPAYFVVVILCAIFLFAVSTKDLAGYFSVEWVKYVLSNLVFLNFLHPSLPGVFESSQLSVVNGALWTIKIEVMFYMMVPVFVVIFRKFSPFWMLLLFYCLSVIYSEIMLIMAERTGSGLYAKLAIQLPGQLVFFLAGAFLYYYFPLFERKIILFIAAAVFIIALNLIAPLSALIPFALAVCVIFFGLFLYAGNVGRFGDFSYGVYILHFPIIQLLLYTNWFHESPWLYLVTVVLLTLICSIVMWHFVEKRFLLRSNHYITALPLSEANPSVK